MIADGSNSTEVVDLDLKDAVISDSTQVIPADGLLKTTPFEAAPQPAQLTAEQIDAYIKYLRAKHNSQCRKKGFKNHIHRPAGNKLKRKLERQGSLYWRLSLIGELFKDMREQKFKNAKENLTNQIHATNTNNPIDFPKENHANV